MDDFSRAIVVRPIEIDRRNAHIGLIGRSIWDDRGSVGRNRPCKNDSAICAGWIVELGKVDGKAAQGALTAKPECLSFLGQDLRGVQFLAG